MTPDMTTAVLAALAEALEASALAPESLLTDQPAPWDSLATMSAMLAIEEATGKMLDGGRLARCTTAADVLRLLEAA